MTGVVPRAVELHDLSKSFGDVLAVDNLSFAASPGEVTGFLGPNGAGKTTTLRMLLGLAARRAAPRRSAARRTTPPDSVGGVGALLEATGFHPGRSGRDHLRILATAIPAAPGRADARPGRDRGSPQTASPSRLPSPHAGPGPTERATDQATRPEA